ncbi:MAG: hypothetical protein ABMA13_14635 [Chthoniobacteraceae bacterium]
MNWIIFAYLTVLSWGVYGVILHVGRGAMPMGPETAHAGLKAFLWVGIAYFVVAVVGPLVVLKMRGSSFSFTGPGVTWSFIAGVAGAAGAFTLVLALGAAAATMKGAAPSAVMPIVFGGAPVVNAIVAMLVHPPEGGLKSLPLPFVLGILLAAGGGFLVAKFAPSNKGAPAKPAGVEQKAGH